MKRLDRRLRASLLAIALHLAGCASAARPVTPAPSDQPAHAADERAPSEAASGGDAHEASAEVPLPEDEPAAPPAGPCTVAHEPPAGLCGDAAPDRCAIRTTARIACGHVVLGAPAALDADRAAIAATDQAAWLVDLDPRSARPIRRIHDGRLAPGVLLAVAPDAYRLIAGSLERGSVASITVPIDPQSEPAPTEWIEVPDTRAVMGAAQTDDGRTLAWLGRGSEGPLRRIERTPEGAWSTTTIAEAVVHPSLGTVGEGGYAILYSERVPRRALPVLRIQIGDEAPITPSRGRSPGAVFGLAVAPSGGTDGGPAAWLADQVGAGARLYVLERGRVGASIEVETMQAAADGCTSVPAEVTETTSGYECLQSGLTRSPFTMVPASGGGLWLLQVEQRVERDLRVTRRFQPVDPARGMRRPPVVYEDSFVVTADRSTAELVVQRIELAGGALARTERLRVPVEASEWRHSLETRARARAGVLHVIVAPRELRAQTSARYLALDEARLGG